MNFIKANDPDQISELRAKLYQNLTAPIDAMWEQLYIASAQPYLIESKGVTLGYCCITDQNCLLQLFLLEESTSKMDQVIKSLVGTKLVNSASLSSNEPVSFNACLNNSKSIQANTFCFQHSNKPIDLKVAFTVELVSSDDIPAVKEFLKDQIGMDDTFGYTENLVSRKEIYLVRASDLIIATSECRMSDSQPGIADLGIIVKREYQGKGIATRVMQMQVNRLLKAKRKPICSTTLDNLAARKAIERSGFYCSNILFDIHF
ncbi:MAG: GNAT family N-acetyltransferase [Imperialibacter sp.]|uniref:GNAT family N-acetyltransferase n=1 Tax=Imperialibacter sp. TaxID=2038411 RepID=UPI0032EDB156